MRERFKLTNDVAFQCIFGKPGQERITKKLLERILKIEIEDLILDVNKRLLGDAIDDKIGRVDVKARLNDGTKIIIEMQVARYPNMAERVLYYWSQSYVSDLKRGDTYRDLKKTIAILISCENLSNLEEIEKYHTKWQIREKEYTEKILTKDLEIHIIELNKLNEKEKGKEETEWLKLIKKGEIDMSNKKLDEELKEAKEELERITKDPETRELYYQREKDLRDKISFALAEREEGYTRGKIEGKVEGKVEGRVERNKEIIKAMYEERLPIEKIVKISGLKREEIEKILKEEI